MSFQDNDNIQELLSIFQAESEEIFERIFENLLCLENEPANKELSATLYRDLHSIKGALRMVGFNNLQTIIHKIEDIFDKIKSSNIVLDKEKINVITKSIELVLNYLQYFQYKVNLFPFQLHNLLDYTHYHKNVKVDFVLINHIQILKDLV